MTHRIQNAPNVDVEDAAVFGLGGLIQWAYPLNAGVVKSDVEAGQKWSTVKSTIRFTSASFATSARTNAALTAEFLNFSDDLCAFFFTATSQNDLGASTSEFDRGGLADTGCSSGHECNFV